MSPQSPTILVVDDDARTRLVLRRALEVAAYSVAESESGRDALSVVQEELPSLILLDLVMPEMTGMEVLESLQSLIHRGKPKVIILTAHPAASLVVQALRRGASDFLEKPVSLLDLRFSVAAALDEEQEVPYPILPPDRVALAMARREIGRHDYHRAAELLEQVAAQPGLEAAYFNLLGILQEAKGNPRRAARLFAKALAFNRRYEPARQNVIRLRECLACGNSPRTLSLGTERDLLASTRVPAHPWKCPKSVETDVN